MERAIELLIKQLENTNESIKRCQMYLTIAVIVCVVAIVMILFIIFKGKGEFTKDKVVIGDVRDKKALHKEVERLNRVVERLEKNQQKII